MSPWQRKLRRALGSVKDQTTIGLAKVSGAIAPELEVAIVKATSHDKLPVEEKHVQEVVVLTSTSRAYSMACVTQISRRLSRTQNWIVALKTLMLIHRLLKEGGYAFSDDLFRESRAGSRILDLSGFRDDEGSSGWENSAFIRTYALYLDELLDYISDDSSRTPSTDSGRLSNSSTSSYGRRSGSDAYGSTTEECALTWQNVSFKQMKPQELFDRMPAVQRLLERVLACDPVGATRMDRLILSSLEEIVRDSFQFYENVRDGLTILLDAFFEMDSENCARAFDIHATAAKQAEALTEFYAFCKSSLGCRSSDYPFVQKIPEELLETMEVFLLDLMARPSQEQPGRNSTDSDKVKALPIPPPPLSLAESASTEVLVEKHHPKDLYLPDTNDSFFTIEDQENSSRLPPSIPIQSLTWEEFDQNEERKPVSGWELGLFSPHSDQVTIPPDGDSASKGSCLFTPDLHERGGYHQLALSQPKVHMSSLITSDIPSSSILALPAPNAPPEEDPFVASSSIPPPSYVQMSDMQKKQALLMQEQMLWERYRRDALQRRHRPATSYSGPMDGVLQSFPSVPFL